jgi:metallo-beta-lactamase family protein
VLIPSFAVGRTQDLLYALSRNYAAWKVDRWQVFLDSPLAIEATEVYHRHLQLYNKEAAHFWGECHNSFMLPELNVCRYAEESMTINELQHGALIIAGSGMCEGGRIRHHLKHNLWRNNCHVIMVGYQVEGTLGRALVDGASTVELWGKEVEVNAAIHTIGGFSAHADREGLLEWYHHIQGRPPVVLVHGEEGAREHLAVRLRGEGSSVFTPSYGVSLNLQQL